jgi:hypothetical protein
MSTQIVISERGALSSTPRFQATECLTTSNVGTTLLLKLCGFIEDQQAEVLDVSEDQLRLRIGRSWFARLWRRAGGHGPLEVTLDIVRSNTRKIDEWRHIHAPHAQVLISVRPLGRFWKQADFQECAEQLVQRLRRYLMTG